MARKLCIYGTILGVLVSILTVLFWIVLVYGYAQGEGHARGLDAAIFLLTTVVTFPLSLLTIAVLESVDYPEPLVQLAVILGPIVSFALWGLLVGAVVDAAVWLWARFRRTRAR